MSQCQSKIAVSQKGVLAPFYAQCMAGLGHVGMHYWEQAGFDLACHRVNGPALRLRGTGRIGWDDPDTYGEKSQAYILNGLTVEENGAEREPELTVQPYEVRPWIGVAR